MVTAAGSRGDRRPDGPLRFDARRDLPELVPLLRLGFGADLSPQDLRWLDDLSRISGPSLTLHSLAASLPGGAEATGQVYYVDSQLVGNISAFRCGRDLWVLANVVTHPAWRRQGIAQTLLRLALQDLGRRGARQVQLQVRADNLGAQRIYAAHGFWRMNAVAVLRRPRGVAVLSGPAEHPAGLSLRPYRRHRDAAAARRLLRSTGLLDRGGPSGLLQQAIELGWLDNLDDWLCGRRRRSHLALAGQEVVGAASLLSQESQGGGRLDLAVHPAWQGRVEEALLHHLLLRSGDPGAADLEAEVDPGAAASVAALERAGFQRRRVLERLALDLG